MVVCNCQILVPLPRFVLPTPEPPFFAALKEASIGPSWYKAPSID